MSETRTGADELEDRDPGGKMTIAMIQGEPAVVYWGERDLAAALATAHDMGLPVAVS